MSEEEAPSSQEQYAKQVDQFSSDTLIPVFSASAQKFFGKIDTKGITGAIAGEFNDYMSTYISQKCHEWLNLGVKTGVFVVDSPGGNVDSCHKILSKIDEMRKVHGLKIVTYVTGMAASCAQVTNTYVSSKHMGYSEGGSFIAPHARILAHQVSTSLPTKSMKTGAIDEMARDVRKTNNKLFRTLDSRFSQKISDTLLALTESGSILEKDKFLDANEALALKLADAKGHVVLRVSMEPPPVDKKVFPIMSKVMDEDGSIHFWLDARHTDEFDAATWEEERKSQAATPVKSQADALNEIVQKIHSKTTGSSFKRI